MRRHICPELRTTLKSTPATPLLTDWWMNFWRFELPHPSNLLQVLAKAFDKVPHRRLLHKLDYYGIRGSTHKWINSWLSGRTQKVVLDGKASDPVPVLSGVPQGSVLGPILFLIFINNLPDNIRSSVRLFADDCVLYRNIHSIQDCFILQEDLTSLGQWEGAQWLSGRVLDSRPKGRGFEPHRRHCVVVLEQDTFT